ncbi:hypothetical protein DRO69_06885 [Candidatus Bathyarchaeota archaeon]|nr:MAG: hypothetical protein DRO69_06885 [Candidatus Bathyarchaeota archaeon]
MSETFGRTAKDNNHQVKRSVTDSTFHVLLDYGKYCRIWPYIDKRTDELYVSVGLARSFKEPLCKLLLSRDYGESWDQIADFQSMDKRNTTTGQPFITAEGVILLPVWNAGFYTHGATWFAIYRSYDHGASWQKVYEDVNGTYANHFFQDISDGSIYIGVGVGGGGTKNRVRYAPTKSYLLKSPDLGTSWQRVLEVDYPTALYGGTAFNGTVLATAREKKAVFRSVDGGNSWFEIYLGNIARSATYIEELEKTVISSNSSIFVSSDSSSWIQIKAPIIGLALRYPTFYKGQLYMTGVGYGGSYVISTNLNKWQVIFDEKESSNNNFFARMAIANDYIFLGGELNGVLLRVKASLCKPRSINAFNLLKTNLIHSFLLIKRGIRKNET